MNPEKVKVMIVQWATETFGKIHYVGDLFNVDEEVFPSSEKGFNGVKIVLHIKKTLGYEARWTNQSTLNEWESYLKGLVGEHIKFEMKSNRGKEVVYLGEVRKQPDSTLKYMELPGTVAYNYQFRLEVILRARSKTNATISRRRIKRK